MIDAEMTAAIAAAAALEPTESDDTTDPAVADSAPLADGAEPDHDDADGSGAADTDDAGDDEDSDDAEGASSESLSSVGTLFADGDVAGACKALGIDPKILNINVPKFEAMRKGLAKTKALEAAATAKETAAEQKLAQANAVIADGKKRYGELVDLKLALKSGDFHSAKELLIALAPEGVTYQQIAEGIAAAAKGTSPSELAYRRKLRELAEKERKAAEDAETAKTAQSTAATETARAEKNKASATKLLKGTLFEGLPGAEDALVKLAQANWDPTTKGLKVPPAQLVKLLAKDPLLGAAAELRRLKAKPPAPAAKKVETPRTERGRFTKQPDPKASKAAKADEERKAAIAEAARMEQASARAARKGAR